MQLLHAEVPCCQEIQALWSKRAIFCAVTHHCSQDACTCHQELTVGHGIKAVNKMNIDHYPLCKSLSFVYVQVNSSLPQPPKILESYNK